MTKGGALGSAVFALAAVLAAPLVAAEASLICMNAGNQYQVGDYACLPGCHGRQRYARCDPVAENTTWTYISDVCPMALLAPAEPTGVSFAPIRTSMSPIPYDIPMNAIDPATAERIAGLKTTGPAVQTTALAAR